MNERNEYRNIVVNGLLNIQIAINGGLTISIVSVRHKIRYKKRIEWRRVCVCIVEEGWLFYIIILFIWLLLAHSFLTRIYSSLCFSII